MDGEESMDFVTSSEQILTKIQDTQSNGVYDA